MDWLKEAHAVIEDVKPFVRDISISSDRQSSDHRIYMDLETLDNKHLLIRMDSNGFSICHNEIYSIAKKMKTNTGCDDKYQCDQGKVYETIYALLSDNSSKYQQSFSEALIDKLRSIEQVEGSGD